MSPELRTTLDAARRVAGRIVRLPGKVVGRVAQLSRRSGRRTKKLVRRLPKLSRRIPKLSRRVPKLGRRSARRANLALGRARLRLRTEALRFNKRLRWSLHHTIEQVEEATPVKALVSMNVLSGKDRFVLAREQRDQLMGMAQADVPVWVPPGCLQWSVTGQRRKRSNFIHFEVAQKTVRLSEHTTSIFIDKIIRQRRALEETTLYRIALSPNSRVWRQISSEGVKHRVRLDSEESLRAYHARCIDLAASIARHGVMPMQSQEGADWRERDGEDGDVLVAIDENGRFLHFRRGRHRMAIAQALGVERMPVLIHVMSGRYLLRFLRRWEVLVPGRLERAMRAAIAHAVEEANKRIGVILLLCAA